MSGLPDGARQERADAAADWLLRLHAVPHDDALLSQWLDWCAEDPENLREFERMSEMWNAFDAKELRALIAMGGASHGRRRRPRARRARSGLSVAASVAAAVVLATLTAVDMPMSEGSPIALETARNRSATDLLADGTRVDMGGQARITGRYSKRLRELEIEEGEAFFDVAKDPLRPFIVRAGEVRVRAVGTAFNVRKGNDSTVVTVTHGLVEVTSAEGVAGATAGPGEQVIHKHGTDRLRTVRVDAETMAAWARESRTLKFEDEPLAAVVGYLNRRSGRQIVIRDGDLARLTFTGTFHHDRGDDWLLALEKAFPLYVTHRDDGSVLLSPRKELAAAERDS